MSLSVHDYSAQLALETPFQPEVYSITLDDEKNDSSSSASYSQLLQSLLRYFLSEYRKNHKAHHQAHSHATGGNEQGEDHENDPENEENDDDEMSSEPNSECRSILRSLLTVRSPAPIPDDIQKKLDSLLQFEQRKDVITAVSAVPTIAEQFAAAGPLKDVASNLSLWRGDITTLAADCIVNAANSALLGCFQPSHLCIDNIIHAAAGPHLRLDCSSIMRKQGVEEKIGQCKVTRGYHLPARYVLHTVGPQIDSGRSETDSERRQLASCYVSCLNRAAQLKNVRSVAFCCISTGLFGFPAHPAAQIAVHTVSEWLKNQNDNQVSKIERVIFNVFKESDEKIYSQLFTKLTGATQASFSLLSPASASSSSSSSPSSSSALSAGLSFKLSQAADWVGSADALLIAAGAGLSASAGLDYTSEQVFKRLFPAMHRRGFRRMYEFIGFSDWTPQLQWGYLLSQINLARFNWRSQNECQVYQTLLKLFSNFGDSSFVLTSNADGMFGQNGFDLDRVYTAQGDYGLMQCLKPCSPESMWPTKPFIDAALPYIDKNTQEITNPSVIPKCKRCGGPVMMNVRGGNWFMEQHLVPKRRKYFEWLNRMLKEKKRLVVLEIGVGFNTAPVIRFPMEALAERQANVRLIRINQQQPQVPKHLIGERALALELDATQAMPILAKPILERIRLKSEHGRESEGKAEVHMETETPEKNA